ncbi:hypothetical protein Dip518_000989 [Parelusimicrobium proximum]|uniref:hypothetical protein n=1 Tax=Parelusimicrobium proximum TaxID=3228953 RepID=UPI003D166BAF
MNKILGYFLLCAGVVLLSFSCISMFKVFTGSQAPMQLLREMNMSVTTQMGPVAVNTAGLVPMMNLMLHGILMLFAASIGGRLMSVGVNLVKIDMLKDSLARMNRRAVLDNQKDIEKL